MTIRIFVAKPGSEQKSFTVQYEEKGPDGNWSLGKAPPQYFSHEGTEGTFYVHSGQRLVVQEVE